MLQAIFGPKSFAILDYTSLGAATGGVDITSGVAHEFAVTTQSLPSQSSSSSSAGLYDVHVYMAHDCIVHY